MVTTRRRFIYAPTNTKGTQTHSRTLNNDNNKSKTQNSTEHQAIYTILNIHIILYIRFIRFIQKVYLLQNTQSASHAQPRFYFHLI